MGSVVYAHLIIIFRKINPLKKYNQFTYYDEKSFKSAAFGACKNDVFKIDGNFYQVDTKEITSHLHEVNNIIVKHGRHIIKEYKN